ncbi:FtsX-like permease family protein [Dactylosporangium sp. NPDC000244]|uniref:FtsX-like permease family protein n=1 Tax=Dactylosporangium sp. NPDC000244 TaxID=3154365 RepID=UPI00331DF970
MRIARREAARAKGRTALIVGLIMLPVLALSFVATTLDQFTLTPAEQADRDLGGFDATVQWAFDGPIQQGRSGEQYRPARDDAQFVHGVAAAEVERTLQAALPPGSTLVHTDEHHRIAVTTAAGRAGLPVHLLDLADPRWAGHLELLDGRAPATDAEAALDAAAMDRLGTRLGGTFTLPDDKRRFTVVGQFERPGDLNGGIVMRPGALPMGGDGIWYVDAPAPLTWDQVRTLNEHGIVARSRAVLLGPEREGMLAVLPDEMARGDRTFQLAVLVLGMATLEVVLLAGPAFAVGARRRRRELGLVAASGGSPGHLRRIVLADGLVLGAAAALTGIAIGVAGALAARPIVAQYVMHVRPGGLRVPPGQLLAVAVLAVLTGVLAALAPAITAGRTDVLTALNGRRLGARTGRRLAAAGLAGLAAGAAIAALGITAARAELVLLGLVVAELGLVLSTPAVLGAIARLGGGLPPAVRIAVRDAARNRASAAPAVSAVMAAVIGSTALAAYQTSVEARTAAMYVPTLPVGTATVIQRPGNDGRPAQLPTDRLRDAVAALPVREVTEIRAVTCADRGRGRCDLQAIRPPENRCPYDPGAVTPEQQRAAVADPRCDELQHVIIGDSDALHIVDDGAALGPIGGITGPDLERAREVLAAGGVVVGDPMRVYQGKAHLIASKPGDEPLEVPGFYAPTARSLEFVAISPQAVARAGLGSAVVGIVAATTRPPTTAESDAFSERLAHLGHGYDGQIMTPRGSDATLTLLLLAVAAGIVTLGATGIATGLSAVDSRPDHATLGAVGASPGVRRRLALSSAGLIAGLGSLLGAAGGLGAGAAVLAALNRTGAGRWPSAPPVPFTWPWPSLAITLVVVPLIAMAAGGLLTRSRLPVERRL